MAIICPICSASISLQPAVIEDEQAVLPRRSSEGQTVYERARVDAVTDDDDPHYVGYAILVCQDCNNRFVAKKHRYDDYEWVPVYPIPHKPVAEELPDLIKSEFNEAQLCFSIGVYRACVAICQMVLETVWREQDASGLNDLKERDIISGALFNRATEIRLWANIAKHEELPDVITREDALQLITYLETILHHVYVEPVRLASLQQKREQLDDK